MSADFQVRYSVVDRMLHRLAFRSAPVLADLAGIEDTLFRRSLDSADPARPVFLTSLPRAGTTMLLELLVDSGAFAAHTYRDMPFVLTPLLWDRFASRFRSEEGVRERAHGDGMLVGVDSPEAFEEMLWKAFWREKYHEDRIAVWTGEEHSEFPDVLRAHMRKIILLRRSSPSDEIRYLSKNNLNIARIRYLERAFPDALILVPIRDPVQQALSLLRQHRNFEKIHREDRFAARYMEAIGHYDFGVNLRPVDFGGWFSSDAYDPRTLEFWLAYWVAAYSSLSEHAGDAFRLISYGRLCRDPEATLRGLARTLELPSPARLLGLSGRIREPGRRDLREDDAPEALVSRARALHTHLVTSIRSP